MCTWIYVTRWREWVRGTERLFPNRQHVIQLGRIWARNAIKWMKRECASKNDEFAPIPANTKFDKIRSFCRHECCYKFAKFLYRRKIYCYLNNFSELGNFFGDGFDERRVEWIFYLLKALALESHFQRWSDDIIFIPISLISYTGWFCLFRWSCPHSDRCSLALASWDARFVSLNLSLSLYFKFNTLNLP